MSGLFMRLWWYSMTRQRLWTSPRIAAWTLWKTCIIELKLACGATFQ